MVEVIRGHVQHQQGVWPDAWRPVADAPKIGWRAQPLFALHRRSRRRCAQRELHDGQALAPAQAATFEDGTAGRGKHAFEKAVLPSARDALRLVSTLGHGEVGPWQSRPERPGEI